MSNVYRGRKRVLDPLWLEVQAFVGFSVVAGNGNPVLWKSSQCS